MVRTLRRCDVKWFFFKIYKIEGDVSSRLVPGSLRSQYEIISKNQEIIYNKIINSPFPFLSPRKIGCCSRVQSCPTLKSNWTLSQLMLHECFLLIWRWVMQEKNISFPYKCFRSSATRTCIQSLGISARYSACADYGPMIMGQDFSFLWVFMFPIKNSISAVLFKLFS